MFGDVIYFIYNNAVVASTWLTLILTVPFRCQSLLSKRRNQSRKIPKFYFSIGEGQLVKVRTKLIRIKEQFRQRLCYILYILASPDSVLMLWLMTTLSDCVIKYLAKDLVCKIWKVDIFHIHFKLIFRKCAYAYNLEKCHTEFVSVQSGHARQWLD